MDLKPIRPKRDEEAALSQAEAWWDAPAGSPKSARLDVLVLLIEHFGAPFSDRSTGSSPIFAIRRWSNSAWRGKNWRPSSARGRAPLTQPFDRRRANGRRFEEVGLLTNPSIGAPSRHKYHRKPHQYWTFALTPTNLLCIQSCVCNASMRFVCTATRRRSAAKRRLHDQDPDIRCANICCTRAETGNDGLRKLPRRNCVDGKITTDSFDASSTSF